MNAVIPSRHPDQIAAESRTIRLAAVEAILHSRFSAVPGLIARLEALEAEERRANEDRAFFGYTNPD